MKMFTRNHKYGATDEDRMTYKSSNNSFLRCSLFFVSVVIFLPLTFFDSYSADIEIGSEPTTLVVKNVDVSKDLPPYGDQRKQKLVSKLSPDSREKSEKNLVLTAYLEPPETLIETGNIRNPLVRNTSLSRLRSISFPNTGNCMTLMKIFPVDDFPLDDPYLPWIHDYFLSADKKMLHFVAQNRRKCDTGVDHAETMNFWMPQLALFQGVPIVVERKASTQQSKGAATNNNEIYQLASSYQDATHNSTRFQCRFHHENITVTKLSVFPFDYELITWMKGQMTMGEKSGKKDSASFWMNQLLFSCPVPDVFRTLFLSSPSNEAGNRQQPAFHADLIPIRTPARSNYQFLSLANGIDRANRDLKEAFGTNHTLPPMDDAGRWQNLPICDRSDSLPSIDKLEHIATTETAVTKQKPYRLVACTWTAASYHRRGDSISISDSDQRLREWIQFHLMVGFDHIYIYDNSDTSGNMSSSSIHDVSQSFGRDQVTYHAWPSKVCNNNKPANKNPGVRSSQYAAESSCRSRYGDVSEWMSFIDTDEYLIPMKQNEDGEYNWYPIIDEMEEKGISIMKFLSSRGKPRIELTEILKDQSVCVEPSDIPKKSLLDLPVEPCVGPMKNKTFLQLYNCDYIRPPKPTRFKRAMKQIYRTSFVLSHFVHYSSVTVDMEESYNDFILKNSDPDPKKALQDFRQGLGRSSGSEMFMNEMTHGALVHARSVLPYESRRRSAVCSAGSKHNCGIGYLCEDDVEYVDELHGDNVFKNPDGSYCNCWRNKVVEEILVPKLESLLSSGH
mmetsp:Transcript_18108/g.41727  ORF Transcript_18108/g.41727 Transcript_18108/m.41727 type:complete len:787 (+) Transcript_18108:230-2590(+)